MKKILVLAAAAIAVCASSCTKDTLAPEAGKTLVPLTFTASSESLNKTVLNSDRSVSFTAGDSISVFANGTNYKFVTAKGGASAVFEGQAEEAATYYALYPYQKAATISGGVIANVDLPQGSSPCPESSFAPAKAISVAVSTSKALVFKNVTALFKFTVPEDMTDLSQIVVFSRNKEALTGVISVAPSADGAPVIDTVTTKRTQVGAIPTQKAAAFAPGVYYLPVLPFTTELGLDLSLTFTDGFNSRGFNGNAMTIQTGKVYNLGTMQKTNTFLYESFDIITTLPSNKFQGNSGALSIGNNPCTTGVNKSAKCLKDDMSASTGSTSGYINWSLEPTKFPKAIREKYTKFRVLVYLGDSDYYPFAQFNNKGDAAKVHPTSVNGIALDGTQETYKGAIKTDEWNVFEWEASAFGLTNLSTMTGLTFKLFVNFDKSNIAKGAATATSTRKVWLDDFTFVR